MAELIEFTTSRDSDENVRPLGDIIAPSKFVNACVLSANIGQSVTIPVGAKVALFCGTSNFYVNWQAAASVPSANITDGSGPELNPVARDVSEYGSFSLVAPADCIVTVAYFS